MGLETATFISDLNVNNPVGATDPKSQGDDHLRLIKATMLNTFPNIAGAMNASHVELNNLVGITGKTGSGNLVLSASPTFTGTIIGLVGSGAGLTALNATQLTTGTIPSARINVAAISHDALGNYFPNHHIDHGTVSISAGNGLTGGGAITVSRSLHVGAGSGITVNADDVAVDGTVVRTTGAATISGTKTFSGAIRFLDPISFEDIIIPPSLAGGSTTDNYAPTGIGTANVIRLSALGAASLTGLTGGDAGRIIYLLNIGDHPITLLDDNAGSTAANRFRCVGAGAQIAENGGVMILYDATSNRWRVLDRA